MLSKHSTDIGTVLIPYLCYPAYFLKSKCTYTHTHAYIPVMRPIDHRKEVLTVSVSTAFLQILFWPFAGGTVILTLVYN